MNWFLKHMCYYAHQCHILQRSFRMQQGFLPCYCCVSGKALRLKLASSFLLQPLDGSECPLNLKLSVLRGIDEENMSIEQRDALLLFRTLCKMGMKEDNDEVTTKTRILSLELLQVTTLSRIAQGTQSVDPNSVIATQIGSIKGSSLQCLVSVLKSLVDWDKLRRESKQSKDQISIEEDSSAAESQDNPGLFKNADIAYVLAYAVIMLNTDAHNPMVWPKSE